MLLNIIIVVVMLIALISMMACSKKAKSGGESQDKAQKKALVLLLVVVAGAVWLLIRLNIFGGGDAGLVASEQAYAKSRAYVVAQAAAKVDKGPVLILVSRGYAQNQASKMIVDGIKEGLGSVKSVIQDVAPAKSESQNGPDPDMLSAADFNRAIEQNDQCKLIIPVVALPIDRQNIRALTSGDKKFALINGSAQEMEKEILSGKVVALACIKPGFEYKEGQVCPSDPKEAFKDRYALVDAKNVKTVIAELASKAKSRKRR